MARRNQKLPSKKVRPPTRVIVLNPSKGLNTLVAPTLVDDKEFVASLNMQYDGSGVARQRDGITRVGGGTGGTTAFGLGILKTETLNRIVTTSVSSGVPKFWTWNQGDGFTYASGTGAVFTTVGQGIVNFTQAQNKLFAWNGADGGIYYDGTTFTQPGTMPSAGFSIYFQNKHIAAGTPTQRNRLYIANINDASDFTVATGGTPPQPDNSTDVPGATVFAGTPGLTEANIIDIRKNDGDKITGLGTFQNQIIVFKERSIYSLTFDASGAPVITPITYATGCVSHRSIVPVENDLYFLSRQGLRSLGNQAQFFDAIRTTVLSTPIQPILDKIDASKYYTCTAIYYKDKYILSVPVASTDPTYSATNSTIVYDRRFSAFAQWATVIPESMLVFTDTSNKDHLYMIMIGNPSGQLHELTQGAVADGLDFQNRTYSIDSYFETKVQTFGNPDITKFYVDVGLILQSVNGYVTITCYDDDNNFIGQTIVYAAKPPGYGGFGIDPIGLAPFGQNQAASTSQVLFSGAPIRISLNRQLRGLKVRIECADKSSSFTFSGIIYAVFPASHYLFDSSRKLYI